MTHEQGFVSERHVVSDEITSSPLRVDHVKSPFNGKNTRIHMQKASEVPKIISPRNLYTSRGDVGYLNKINQQSSITSRETSPMTDHNRSYQFTKAALEQSRSKYD